MSPKQIFKSFKLSFPTESPVFLMKLVVSLNWWSQEPHFLSEHFKFWVVKQAAGLPSILCVYIYCMTIYAYMCMNICIYRYICKCKCKCICICICICICKCICICVCVCACVWACVCILYIVYCIYLWSPKSMNLQYKAGKFVYWHQHGKSSTFCQKFDFWQYPMKNMILMVQDWILVVHFDRLYAYNHFLHFASRARAQR